MARSGPTTLVFDHPDSYEARIRIRMFLNTTPGVGEEDVGLVVEHILLIVVLPVLLHPHHLPLNVVHACQQVIEF
jgi:hypothetical protein